jgi:transcriptional regulator with XRE-family HTH domain
MTPLGQLIEERKAANDPPLTNADIARRMNMSRQRVQQLINDDLPDVLPTATLRALADAIGVPVVQVVTAMLDTADLPTPTRAAQAAYRAGFDAGLAAAVKAIEELR